MFIKNLELVNIKSYTEISLEFALGATAITGHNGAGKTTIIEAIAWVLFDHLNYTKEEFIRHGEKKGSVRLTFVSGLDEREYEVYRDTGSAYFVEDPQLKIKLANKKAEVQRFLWQHLGLEPGADLESLFKHAIGVPQGTFTAIFLDGATERKTAFDRLLKVEEYRQASDKLRDTAKFLDNSTATVREKIARAEGELARSESVTEEHKGYQERIQSLTAVVADLSKEAADASVIVATMDRIEKFETSIAVVKKDQQRLNESLESIEKAKATIETLKPWVFEQERLEGEISGLREKIAAANAIKTQFADLDERIKRLRLNYRSTADQLKEAQEKATGAEEVAALELRSTELVQTIAGFNADLTRNEKFQHEVQNGLCPILSQKCLNLKPDQSLSDFMSSNFADVKQQIRQLQDEQGLIVTGLTTAREAVRFAAQLPGLQAREAELKDEGTRLATEKDLLEKQIVDLGAFETQLATSTATLNELGDPRSRIRILESETAREAELRMTITTTDSELTRLWDDRMSVSEDPYDADIHTSWKAALREAERLLADRSASLGEAQRREVQLAAEIKHFTELRQSLTGEFQEKERLEKASDLTKFIRETLKEAAPRVARNYVYRVSLEANQMFREITGKAEHTLRWTDDYLIMLEEDGFDRPFSSLSGGEQMAAALSVRLALLKQLTDIRIAFFDEPTTNMDAERRENLAMQISNITNFDQLFVISHDDTFEGYVDTVLSIEGK